MRSPLLLQCDHKWVVLTHLTAENKIQITFWRQSHMGVNIGILWFQSSQDSHTWGSILVYYDFKVLKTSTHEEVWYIVMSEILRPLHMREVCNIVMLEFMVYCDVGVHGILWCWSSWYIVVSEFMVYCGVGVHGILWCRSLWYIVVSEFMVYCDVRVLETHTYGWSMVYSDFRVLKAPTYGGERWYILLSVISRQPHMGKYDIF